MTSIGYYVVIHPITDCVEPPNDLASWKISNGRISATGHTNTMHFMFGSRWLFRPPRWIELLIGGSRLWCHILVQSLSWRIECFPAVYFAVED